EEVARQIAQHMNGPKLVITKSTVPIGTGRMIERIIAESGNGHKASVVSNPEFLREGSAIEDFMKPDRVVIGASDAESADLMKEIYAPLHSLEIPFVVTNVESSELIKYAANGFLATKITFINEIAVVCEKVGANVQDVAIGMGLDSRIGPKFLQAGPGFGGSCFPKDTSAMADISRRHGYEFQIMEAVLRVNDDIKERMVVKIVDALGGEVGGKTVAVLGLAFKPETDDMRDSPTIPIIKGLQAQGAKVRAYDPQAMENSKAIFEGIEYCDDAYETADGADALVIATEWNAFRALNLERIRKALRRPIVVDLRNVYEPHRMKSEGFEYYSVGRAFDGRRKGL
ncbi:MAG TPA: UDP-glucose/GDP-mannose dehydrogenase family protein, partial [Thermoanaerobaculia bacterium]|nr:UDP-glucose/GDP-mannose dehydrogenase family protein [Thermoanaerobaculia bacterium]